MKAPIAALAAALALACPPARGADSSSAGGARYELVRDWPALPSSTSLGQPSGIGVDSAGNVFVFHRGDRTWTTPFPTNTISVPTVLQLDGRTGKLLGSWGANLFVMPHGLTLDREDNVWVTDVALQQVFKFTHEGKLLLTVGERGKAGADKTHFNLPSDVAVLPDRSFYVSDGYRNTRVVKFTAEGRYEFEWGGKGAGPGEFNLPHGIALDGKGRVIVCDRTNARLQLFDLTGKFLAEWKGKHIGRPYGVTTDAAGHVYVADGGNIPGAPAGSSRGHELDANGTLLSDIGTAPNREDRPRLAHDIAVAKDGSVYIADSGGRRVLKFRRR